MDQDAKKTALRMIPYGIYVLTADDGSGQCRRRHGQLGHADRLAAPLVVVGVKTDSGAYQIVKDTKTFALNMLGKDGKGVAFTFFKPTKLEDGKLSGQAIHKGSTGAPILDAAPAAVECRVTGIVEQGDHHIVVGEVVEAHVAKRSPGVRRRDPRNEGARRQRLLRRLTPALAFGRPRPSLVGCNVQIVAPSVWPSNKAAT
jgi:flavin reductase (DIM6/NTAB) family NADH-FMN oxidoreductase RutF